MHNNYRRRELGLCKGAWVLSFDWKRDMSHSIVLKDLDLRIYSGYITLVYICKVNNLSELTGENRSCKINIFIF